MNILSLSALKPMVVEYRLDDDINIPSYTTNFLYGLNLYSNNLFNLAKDISINYYNTFLLSEKFDKKDFITFTTPVSVSYPKKFSTTIQTLRLSAYGRGFWTDYTQNYSTSNYGLSCGATIFSNGSIYNLGTWNVYEITLINESECTITKYREIPPYVVQNNQEIQYLNIAVDNGVNSLVFSDTENRFNYIYNREQNTIVFYKNYQPRGNEASSSILVLAQEGEKIVVKSLDVNMISSIGLYNYDAVFLLSYRDANTRITDFTTNLNEYKKYFFPTTDTNFSSSVAGLKNNYLISSDVEFTDNKFLINFQPLKNQLDVDYNFTDNSNFSGSSFDNRDYQTIVTGTNQELGFPDLTLTYYTYNAPLQFKKGALTYFHFPVSATPFNKLNVNDTKLVENGAFAGNNPINSDKIFKKQESTANRDHITGEQTGTYLCTWLYTSSFDSKPIWLDRYYNPNYTSIQNAFLNYAFVDMVGELQQAENITYFDKVSDLVFEPNASYSYYRIAEKDISRIASEINEKSTSEGSITVYDLDYNLVQQESNKIEIEKNKGTVFQTASSTGDLSITFKTNSRSYKNKKGGILLSTYNGETGFVLSNNKQLNSFNFLTSGGTIFIYDKDYNLLETAQVFLNKDTFKSPDQILSIDYDNIVDGYYITSCTTDPVSSASYGSSAKINFYVSKLDPNFTTVNTKTLTGYTAGSTSNIISTYVDDKYYYTLFNNLNVNDFAYESQGYYFTKFPLSGFDNKSFTLSSYTSQANLTLYPSNVNGVPSIDRADFYSYRYTYNFVVSSYSPQFFLTDYTNNAIINDVYNRPWYIFNGQIFHSVTNIGSLSGFNMVYERRSDENGLLSLNGIVSLNSDNEGNIYYISQNPNNLSNKTLVKLDNNRVPLFKIPLSSNTDSLSANDFIDINYTLNNGKIEPQIKIISDAYEISYLSAGDRKNVATYSKNGELISDEEISIYTDTNIRNTELQRTLRRSFNNNQNIISNYNIGQNYFNFDLYLRDSNNDKEKITFTQNLNHLTNDELFFTLTFNSRNGEVDLYINSVKVGSKTVDRIKYALCQFNSNISINSLNFLPINLFRGFFNGGDLQFSNIRAYNKVLNSFDIRNLYLENVKLDHLSWNVPSGKRNIQETIQQNFKFGLPQYKSNLFDIIINGTEDLTEAQKEAIKVELRSFLKSNIPANTNINEIEIRNNE